MDDLPFQTRERAASVWLEFHGELRCVFHEGTSYSLTSSKLPSLASLRLACVNFILALKERPRSVLSVKRIFTNAPSVCADAWMKSTTLPSTSGYCMVYLLFLGAARYRHLLYGVT